MAGSFDYTCGAVVGETYIRDDKGVPVASFFTTAYLKWLPGTLCALRRSSNR